MLVNSGACHCNTIGINPYLTNGFSHHYQLGESTFIFRGVRSDFYFSSHFSIKFPCTNRIASDGTPRSAVCLCPTKRTPGLNELNSIFSYLNDDPLLCLYLQT